MRPRLLPAKGYVVFRRIRMKVEVLSRLGRGEESWLVKLPATGTIVPICGEVEFSDWDDWFLTCPEYVGEERCTEDDG